MVIKLFEGKVIGCSVSTIQDRRRLGQRSVILHSDKGTQFRSSDYERFFEGKYIALSVSRLGPCGDNTAAEGFFGMLKWERDRVNWWKYPSLDDTRADVFD